MLYKRYGVGTIITSNIKRKIMSSKELIQLIYESEIPCRFEWFYDAGFTWSVQDNSFPRILKDDDSDGDVTIIKETTTSFIQRNDLSLEKDWLARGNNYNFDEAILEMAESIVKLFPKATFSKWYKENKI